MENIIERRSNLVIPQNCIELDREEMSYVEGGYFVGIEMTYAQICGVLNGLSYLVDYGPQAWEICKTASVIGAYAALLGSYVSSALAAIPVWGWVAAGVVFASTTALFTYCLMNNCGFKIGLEIGWFSVKGVWSFK